MFTLQIRMGRTDGPGDLLWPGAHPDRAPARAGRGRGQDLSPGEIGEIVTTGPQVVAGYRGKPEETTRAIPGAALRTGDVGYTDARG